MAAGRWAPVFGYEGAYEVSSGGHIRSVASGKLRRLSVSGDGHQRVDLWLNGRQQTIPVHRLVLEAFIGPAPSGLECLHRDGNPKNNTIGNLHWGTKSENALDRVRHGVHNQARKTHCPRDHEYNSANTYIDPNGRRTCRTCRRDAARKRRAVGG